MDVKAVDQPVGRHAGVLLSRANIDDAVDATVVAVAVAGDRIVTSDPQDIRNLVVASNLSILVVPR